MVIDTAAEILNQKNTLDIKFQTKITTWHLVEPRFENSGLVTCSIEGVTIAELAKAYCKGDQHAEEESTDICERVLLQ